MFKLHVPGYKTDENRNICLLRKTRSFSQPWRSITNMWIQPWDIGFLNFIFCSSTLIAMFYVFLCLCCVRSLSRGLWPSLYEELRILPLMGSSSNLCHPLLYCIIILVFPHLSKIFSACISLVLWTVLQ